ncbi:glycosyltransferase family 2 protein [Pleomorphovibrio marinus]|uniref:glycosyltransferase family 2 protein n=1 Tax=Pleomorphovibrio marinus TaxID=2164132 RepID=UPI000E0C0581|nr:glycosyltransferase family A protein [Pleomorphovibrio marinus]
MDNPLVTVICTCYNHADYVFDSLNSVVNQCYSPLELIIIDNASSDNSREVIQNWLWLHDYVKPLHVFFHEEPLGYCSSFNKALFSSTGKYVVDLAADDILLQEHITKAVHALEKSHSGAYFCNALLKGTNGDQKYFYKVGEDGKALEAVPQGDMYEILVRRYALCSATLVFRSMALKKMGGYDESLSYEDFDVMVRMARSHRFVYGDWVGVEKRILPQSYSSTQYQARHSVMLPSTYMVCRKIQLINRSAKEQKALLERVMHESKHALASANFETAGKLLELARELNANNLRYWFYLFWQASKVDLSFFYRKWNSLNFRR